MALAVRVRSPVPPGAPGTAIAPLFNSQIAPAPVLALRLLAAVRIDAPLLPISLPADKRRVLAVAIPNGESLIMLLEDAPNTRLSAA